MGKSCTKAHSAEELQEWIQRKKVAAKKRKQALKDGLLSYQDRLLAEYQTCSNEVFIVSYGVGVHWSCASREAACVRAGGQSTLLAILTGMQKGVLCPSSFTPFEMATQEPARGTQPCCSARGPFVP